MNSFSSSDADSYDQLHESPTTLKKQVWKTILFQSSGHCLMAVLVVLSGYAMWSAVSTAEIGAQAIRSSALSDDYGLAARAVAAAESLERKYRLEPSADVRARYNKVATELSVALDKIDNSGSLEDHKLVASVRASQVPYLEAINRMFAAIDRRDNVEVLRIDNDEVDPRFSKIEDLVNGATAQHQENAVAALENLRSREAFNARTVPLVFSLGLMFAFLFSTALRRVRDQLEVQGKDALRASQHDALTGLPNRTLLHKRFTQALHAGKREGNTVGLLLIDLDRFKEVNDTLGHHYGDRLLNQVGARLSDTIRKGDTVARLGGDEFAILLPNVKNLDEAVEIAHRLRHAIIAAFNIDNIDLDVEASFGVAVSGLHGNDPVTLMQHADIAMYLAKTHGKGVTAYDPDLDRRTPQRLALLGELRRGIERNELFLQYQPKIAVASNKVIGVEALVRWMHPERGLVPPDDFIPFAENTGIIGPLTYHVLNLALGQVRTWIDAGISMPVSVNISARNLCDQTLVSQVVELLQLYDLPTNMLVLEVTESAIMADSSVARVILTQLHEMGVRISIDDFGAGYTSLAQLKHLPISELKIDKSFVLTMQSDPANALIVRSVVDLGHNLGMTVVAEGVETANAINALSDYTCDIAQGYHLCRPINPEAFARWHAEREQTNTRKNLELVA